MKIVIEGMEIEIPDDSRILTQLENLKTSQEEEAHSDARDSFKTMASDAVMDLTNDTNEDALSGMSLIVSLDRDDDPKVVRSALIDIKKRLPRVKKEE